MPLTKAKQFDSRVHSFSKFRSDEHRTLEENLSPLGVKATELNPKERFGSGNHGIVYATANPLVVLKEATHPGDTGKLLTEINIVKGLRHPNIVQYLGVHNSRLVMVTYKITQALLRKW